MRGSYSAHKRTLEAEMTALVRTDLHIAAGKERIANLQALANSPHREGALEMNARLIETVTESVTRLRAYRALLVDAVVFHETSSDQCSDEKNPVFDDAGPVGRLARAIDNAIGALVARHGTQATSKSHKDILTCYLEIEALRHELEVLGVDRSEMLPYMERFSSSACDRVNGTANAETIGGQAEASYERARLAGGQPVSGEIQKAQSDFEAD